MPSPFLQGVRHVCFDKDGTLIDVHRYWAHNSRLRADALGERFDLSTTDRAAVLEAMGVDAASGRLNRRGPVGYAPRAVVLETVVQFLAARRVPATTVEVGELFKRLDARQQEADDYAIDLLPGVRECLARLGAAGRVMTIYSSDRRDNVTRILDRLALRSFFTALVGGESVTKPKPDPEGFLIACREAGVPPAESAYVGDTLDDLHMSARGGALRAIGVTTGLGTAEELAAESPFVVATLDSLVD